LNVHFPDAYLLCMFVLCWLLKYLVLAHLFVKVPRPGDNEGNFSVFESSCHLLLPV